MNRLINAIDKACTAGVYNLEETAQILKAIDQVGAVVNAYNESLDAQKDSEQDLGVHTPVKKAK